MLPRIFGLEPPLVRNSALKSIPPICELLRIRVRGRIVRHLLAVRLSPVAVSSPHMNSRNVHRSTEPRPDHRIDGPAADRVESDRSIRKAEVNFVARRTSDRDIGLHYGPGRSWLGAVSAAPALSWLLNEYATRTDGQRGQRRRRRTNGTTT